MADGETTPTENFLHDWLAVSKERSILMDRPLQGFLMGVM
jgi:hypothetical protein